MELPEGNQPKLMYMSKNPSAPPDAVATTSNGDNKIVFSLNVLFGIAILGLLVTSIQEFGGFTVNVKNFYLTGTHEGGNYKLLSAISMLFDGKMLSLLSLVFGAGISLLMQKKEHLLQISTTDAFIRRQIWFIIFGVFNAFVLLYSGDLLFSLGVIGILTFVFWRMSTKGLLIAAIACTLIYCGKNYWNYADNKTDYKKYIAVTVVEKKFKEDSTSRAKKDSVDRTKDTVLLKDILAKNKMQDSLARKNDTLTKKQAGEKAKWEGIVKGLKYDSSQTKSENKAMREGYLSTWSHLMQRSQNKETYWLYQTGIWDMGSMIFLGMALLAIGFFSFRFSSSKYFLIALITLAIGSALAWLRLDQSSVRIVDYAKYVESHELPYNLFFPIEKMLMATGYASLVMWLLRVKLFNWVWKGLAATGQMAFTNYLLQTIICTFFFYGYGLGYFGRLKQWELYFIVTEIALVQVVFSVLWLRYYSMGPFEWLLRCLVYRKRFPIKKHQTLS